MTPGNAPSRRVTTTTPDTTPRTTLPRAENPASERRDELAQEFAQDGAYAYRFASSSEQKAIDRIIELEARP